MCIGGTRDVDGLYIWGLLVEEFIGNLFYLLYKAKIISLILL